MVSEALNTRYSHCSNRCQVSGVTGVRCVSFGRSVNVSVM